MTVLYKPPNMALQPADAIVFARWQFAFAAVSFYWATGGSAGLPE